MRFAVVVFPGSNCDRDCHHVLNRVMGISAEYVWHRDSDLSGFDAVVIPGGFSYGDYLRAGAVAKISPIMREVSAFAGQGGPVLGICNGFQILLESGLLPGAMLRNSTLKFMCRDVHLRVETSRCAFSASLDKGEVIRMPIANAEGNYTIDEGGLARLEDNEQIVFRYASQAGRVGKEENPNGSVSNIAGVSNRRGNVVGMMPHPERASEAILGNEVGISVFNSAMEWLNRRTA